MDSEADLGVPIGVMAAVEVLAVTTVVTRVILLGIATRKTVPVEVEVALVIPADHLDISLGIACEVATSAVELTMEASEARLASDVAGSVTLQEIVPPGEAVAAEVVAINAVRLVT